jgi:hypothetical protein
VAGYSFRLYVDGASAGFTEVRCANTRSAAGYLCSGLLPDMPNGRHVLELTAVANGVESSRSAVFAVLVARALMPSDDVEDRSSGSGSVRTLGVVCLDVAQVDCYDTRLIAGGLAPVTSAVAASATRLFFIEGDSSVRVAEGERLVERPALRLETNGARLISLALPPDFELTRHVYVAWSEPSSSGLHELNITRYREVQGSLGEGATIVTGLPVSVDAFAPMAFDDGGLLYVAVPGLEPSSLPRARTAFNSSVLRFQADGTVPRGNPTASPVIAQGYARPTALLWDGVEGQLWLAGQDARSSITVATLPARILGRGAWPQSPLGVQLQGDRYAAARAPRLTLTADPVTASRSAWLVSAPGEIQRGLVQAGESILQLSAVELGLLRNVNLIVERGSSGLIVVSTGDQPSGRSSQIWELTRR